MITYVYVETVAKTFAKLSLHPMKNTVTMVTDQKSYTQ